MTYQQRKENARAAALEWQAAQSTRRPTWAEIAADWARWEKIARRSGLVKEFRENGII